MVHFSLASALLFIAVVIIAYALLAKAGIGRNFALGILLWLALQTALSISGLYYENPFALPPRFLLLVAPALAAIVLLFTTVNGLKLVDGLNIRWLTLLHAVRIPVELCLYLLYQQGYVPQLMTFEGANPDIASGIVALIVTAVTWKQPYAYKWLLVVFNLAGLALLFNIVIRAVLSVPSPFQQLAFQQPNIAVLHYPFTLLPGFVVPVVLFSHLVALRQVLFARKTEES